ncbi:MAG TPA: hypothetical protein VJ673_07890 [Aromatoleum sp.]|uniref:hypothetical protein n=1 Tax=Aromatoleum sp. TaxID=2307007 RepID=UPI002B48333D|nr:hypothetical protein [Aromatoleum sp.]HJV25593.1 hypothetical protein [Aromatoleum sp.]
MLTLDDLDHFSSPAMAHLFAPATRQPDADTLARLTRIVACLGFCRDVASDELAEGGLLVARRALRSALRGQQRGRRMPADELKKVLEGLLLAVGDQPWRAGEAPDAAEERHAVEAEIQNAADSLITEDSVDLALLGALARGEFEILPSSNLMALVETLGRFSGAAAIDVDLAIDDAGPVQLVRVHLLVESGFWRWTAKEGSCMSRNGDAAVFLPPDDAVVKALLTGLALRSGRAITFWADAVGARDASIEAQPA